MTPLAAQLTEAFHAAQNRHLARPRPTQHHNTNCGHKICYGTHERAEKALRDAQSRRSKQVAGEKAETRTYYCDAHDGWHLTSWPKPKSTRARRPLLVWKVKWDGDNWQAAHVKSGGCIAFHTWDEAIAHVIADLNARTLERR